MPDEHLYSIIARFHRRTGMDNFRQTKEFLFKKKEERHDKKAGLSLDNFLTCFGVHTKSQKIEYLNKTTLLPLLRLWRTQDSEKNLIDHVLDKKFDLLTTSGKGMGSSATFRFCPKCMNMDIQNFGVAYWHREHMIDGVVVCSLHNTLLMISAKNEKSKFKKGRISLLPSDVFTDGAKAAIDHTVYRDIEWILVRQATFSSFILNIKDKYTKRDCWNVIRGELKNTDYG